MSKANRFIGHVETKEKEEKEMRSETEVAGGGARDGNRKKRDVRKYGNLDG